MILGVMVLSIILDTKIAEAYKVEEVQAVVTVIEPQTIQIEITYSETRIKELIRETFKEDPVTALKVAACESGYNPDATHKNNDGTTDKGIFQLNSVHKKELARLGLDPTDVKDNIKYAHMLYKQEGWKPWACVTRKMI